MKREVCGEIRILRTAIDKSQIQWRLAASRNRSLHCQHSRVASVCCDCNLREENGEAQKRGGVSTAVCLHRRRLNQRRHRRKVFLTSFSSSLSNSVRIEICLCYMPRVRISFRTYYSYSSRAYFKRLNLMTSVLKILSSPC